MKIRRETDTPAGETREEVREMDEAIGLYRSAMRHVADKRPARAWNADAQHRQTHSLRMRLLLVPALGAALAAAVLAPAISHRHDGPAPAVHAPAAAPAASENVASMDDTQLMNQIDSDLTEDVPDALQPLTDLSEQATAAAKTSSSEK